VFPTPWLAAVSSAGSGSGLQISRYVPALALVEVGFGAGWEDAGALDADVEVLGEPVGDALVELPHPETPRPMTRAKTSGANNRGFDMSSNLPRIIAPIRGDGLMRRNPCDLSDPAEPVAEPNEVDRSTQRLRFRIKAIFEIG